MYVHWYLTFHKSSLIQEALLHCFRSCFWSLFKITVLGVCFFFIFALRVKPFLTLIHTLWKFPCKKRCKNFNAVLPNIYSHIYILSSVKSSIWVDQLGRNMRHRHHSCVYIVLALFNTSTEHYEEKLWSWLLSGNEQKYCLAHHFISVAFYLCLSLAKVARQPPCI